MHTENLSKGFAMQLANTMPCECESSQGASKWRFLGVTSTCKNAGGAWRPSSEGTRVMARWRGGPFDPTAPRRVLGVGVVGGGVCLPPRPPPPKPPTSCQPFAKVLGGGPPAMLVPPKWFPSVHSPPCCLQPPTPTPPAPRLYSGPVVQQSSGCTGRWYCT